MASKQATSKLLILALLLTFNVVVSNPEVATANACDSSSFSQNSGDGAGYATALVIDTRSHLENLENCLGAAGIGKHFRLSTNLNLGGEAQPWEPIGTRLSMFEGNLHGEGFSISGLYVEATHAGLFGYLGENASVSNLWIRGEVRGAQVGALAAMAISGADVHSVSTVVDVTILPQSNNSVGGGLFGALGGKTENSKVLSSITNVQIRREGGVGSISGNGSRIGGLIGSVGSEADGIEIGTARAGYTDVTGAYVEVPISSARSANPKFQRVGGLFGLALNSLVSNSSVVSSIQTFQTSVTNGVYVGGIAGSFWYGRLLTSNFKGGIYVEGDFAAALFGEFRDGSADSGSIRFKGSSSQVHDVYASGAIVGGEDTEVSGFVGFLSHRAFSMQRVFSNPLLIANSASQKKTFASLASSSLACPSYTIYYRADVEAFGT
jgi:hypothetical protein